MREWDELSEDEQQELQRALQTYVEKGDVNRASSCTYMNLDWVNPDTGLPLLHYAVARNKADMVRFLLKNGAKVTPDFEGRWPSILALQCGCDDAIIDMIEKAEARTSRDKSPLDYKSIIQNPSETIVAGDGIFAKVVSVKSYSKRADAALMRVFRLFLEALKARHLSIEVRSGEQGHFLLWSRSEVDLDEVGLLLEKHALDIESAVKAIELADPLPMQQLLKDISR